jgi:tRNA (Thr-GGU) A37 N-methylase
MHSFGTLNPQFIVRGGVAPRAAFTHVAINQSLDDTNGWMRVTRDLRLTGAPTDSGIFAERERPARS